MKNDKRVLILGCGVSGLSTGIVLQEAGREVSIWTTALPEATTSNVAAAVWYPYKAYPEDKVLRWGADAYTAFVALVDEPASGVMMRAGVELWREPVPDPWWCSAVPGFGRCAPAALPPGYRDGYAFSAPVIEMPIYLRYLQDRFTAAGGNIELRTVTSLEAVPTDYPIIVNCTGLGAHDLLGDRDIHPIRGQIIRVKNPGLEEFVLDEDNPAGVTYIVPRSSDCILGGTSNEGDWDTVPRPEVAAAIFQRCVAIEPRLADATILEHKVGLRPGRSAIRLEGETLPDGRFCVHNYGHGGSGVTLSWGCAQDAARLVVER